MKTIFVNTLKYISLILLVYLLNSIPTIILLSENYFSTVVLWLLLPVYLFLVVYFIKRLWKNINRYDRQASSKLKFSWKDFGITLLLYVGIYAGNIFGIIIRQVFSGQSVAVNQGGINDLVANMWEGSLPWAICNLLVITVLAPIMEELVFRGFPVTQVCNPDKKILTGMITSSVFAFMHSYMDLISFPGYFIMGMMLYIAYRRRDNIKDSMVLHILNNTIMMILLLLVLFAIGNLPS